VLPGLLIAAGDVAIDAWRFSCSRRGGIWEDEAVLLLREQAGLIILGTIFLFIGVAACCMAAIRGRSVGRILAWFGVFSAMYGLRLVAEVPAAFSVLVGPFSPYAPQLVWMVTYFILIFALLFWAELSLGALRRFFQFMVIPASVIAVAGIWATFFHGPPYRFIPYSNVLAIGLLLILAVANVVPRIGKKYLVIQSRISAIGTLVLAAAVIQENLRTFVNMRHYDFFEPVALALFVFSQGWVAAEKVFSDERRLLSIENELAIAREIQTSILPAGIPQLNRLRISAAYSPMTAVAGDFYWFMAVDPNRVGFLVADVSGHGVPAALIASMIKVAMQSVARCADDPRAVMCGLEQALSGQLRGQFVSAAYLWLDTEKREALYSAAGHPPLLRWQEGRLERIESNGLLFGVIPDCDSYPVCAMPIHPGDRFLLYTDGVTEPENAGGDSFGDSRLEEVVRDNQRRPPAALSDALLDEIRRWQPASVSQQDDITLIVIDVV
jgi:sigma-B regulation protein RsbU (phosphoserine phosphatase)